MKKSGTSGNKMINGPVITYKWKGIDCKRAKGKTGKQAPVAKQQASVLGKASAISARLRYAFKDILGEPTDRKIMYRLNNALQQWLRTGAVEAPAAIDSLRSLDGFYFYGETGDTNPLTGINITRGIDGETFLQIPAIDDPAFINDYPFHGSIRITICFASCDISDNNNSIGFKTEITIRGNEIPVSLHQIKTPLLSAPGKLLVTAVAVNRSIAWIAGSLYN